MPSLFPRWSNTALPLLIVFLVVTAAAAIATPMIYVRTPYNTKQFVPLTQPVEFDHRHHVRDAAIDCLYCHPGAETSASAGVPPTEVCMGCHAQVWNDSPLLEPVRRSYFSGRPIAWQRVHRVADFVYFHHAVHVQRGIGCVRCHGHVDRMASVYRTAPLTMGWCLDCHSNPVQHLQHNAEATIDFEAASGAFADPIEPDIAERRTPSNLTTCSACHR